MPCTVSFRILFYFVLWVAVEDKTCAMSSEKFRNLKQEGVRKLFWQRYYGLSRQLKSVKGDLEKQI